MKILLIIIVIVLLAYGGFYLWQNRNASVVVIRDFEHCVELGGAVMESHPRQCAFGGETFTEEINEPISSEPFQYKDLVLLTSPRSGNKVTSPISVSGRARGNWYFEASFPIEVRDEDGTVIGQGFAQAQGEWMTTDYVPFSGQVTFTSPKGDTGTIVFHKDNPSGLSEFDDSFSIPVKYK